MVMKSATRSYVVRRVVVFISGSLPVDGSLGARNVRGWDARGTDRSARSAPAERLASVAAACTLRATPRGCGRARARVDDVADGRTIVFFPEGAFGPTNNCVGIGDILRRRGHRVVFIVEESFAGNLEAKGFEERLMRLGPAPDEPEVPGQFWIDFIRDTAPVFRKSTLEQIGEFIAPTWQALIDGAKYVDPRLTEIIDELQPDAIVEDNVVAFPALPASGRPWVRITSCNPAELKDPLVAPFSSGYPAADRSAWPAFLDAYRDAHAEMWSDFDAFGRERGAPGLTDSELGPEFIHESPWLNLYVYPAEADYDRARPLGPTWHRLDSSVRATDGAWSLPAYLAERPGKLIYL